MNDYDDDYEEDIGYNDVNVERWWPVVDTDSPPDLAIEVCYALLGPSYAHKLITGLRRSTDRPISDPTVEHFREALERLDGRPPEMLVLLASAMAAVHRRFHEEHAGAPYDDSYEPLLRRTIDTYKFLGGVTVDAVRRFGWTEASFLEFNEFEVGSYYGEMRWPPAGVAYTRRPPESPARHEEDSALNSFRITWPLFPGGPASLVGAHLLDLDELNTYIENLYEALPNAPADIRRGYPNAGPTERTEALEKLTHAVDQITKAREMIRLAQYEICSVFPT